MLVTSGNFLVIVLVNPQIRALIHRFPNLLNTIENPTFWREDLRLSDRWCKKRLLQKATPNEFMVIILYILWD